MADAQEKRGKQVDQVIEDGFGVGKQEEPGPGEGEGGARWLRKLSGLFARVPVRKPVPLSVAALLLVGAGAWGFYHSPVLKGGESTRPHGEPVAEDGLRQEEVARFYVPLPKDGPRQVMVIDWSVVWDGLTAVRFKKAEVMTRDRVYDGLLAVAAKEEGLNENIPMIEETMSRELKDSLRSAAISVRVKEVKTY